MAKTFNRKVLNRIYLALDPLLRTAQNGFRQKKDNCGSNHCTFFGAEPVVLDVQSEVERVFEDLDIEDGPSQGKSLTMQKSH